MPRSVSARDPRTEFIGEATWHGDLTKAEALLAEHPELRNSDIHTAAVLGDDEAVRRFLAQDAANATAASAPHGGDALNYLCLSRYLRLDRSRTPAFLRAATALLDAGADPNTGFWTTGQFPERETALYGAAGVAHHPEMTRLLLERGADPNDEEVVYHSPEAYENDAMKLVVETGRITPEHLALMLMRKHDWHDYDGAKYLLEHGANPNERWGRSGALALHHALARSNGIDMVALLLDFGADSALVSGGLSGAARAAREGRRDVLALFERRGIPLGLGGVDRLVAACASDNGASVHAMTAHEPALSDELRAMGGTLLARFACNGNAEGVRRLLDLGVHVTTRFAEGDGYFGIPKDSLAIHVAAWRGYPAVVQLLLEHGSPADVPDANGRTPLALAVRACVDSYWMIRRSPDSVRALLAAGSSMAGVLNPCGYAEVDSLFAEKLAGQ